MDKQDTLKKTQTVRNELPMHVHVYTVYKYKQPQNFRRPGAHQINF